MKPGVAIGEAVNASERSGAVAAGVDHGRSSRAMRRHFESSLSGLGNPAADRHSGDLSSCWGFFTRVSFIRSRFFPGLPSAAFGALLTLQIFGYGLDLYGFVGVIMLIGIVKKNAIMMVDFAIAREREGHKTAAEAVYQGCLVRFRPIMMTTMAALMGTLPIALGTGRERIRGGRWGWRCAAG